jgi:predicted SAM-dependent methyltransferase
MLELKSALARGLGAVGLEEFGRSVWRRTRAFGLRHQCPICGAHLKGFLTDGLRHAVLAEKSIIGGGRRSTALCPVCRSWDRERLVYLYLKNRRHLLSSGTKLLHVAPEANLGAWLRSRPGLRYCTADLNMNNVDLHLDLTCIPFPDSTFDAIICNHVLEHIVDDAKAMAELFRVLRPGAWAILQVPISPVIDATYEDSSITDSAGRERAFGQHDHVRIYAMDYVDRLKQAGFAVELFRWRADARDYGGERNKFGLIEREIVFFASRKAGTEER